MADALDRLPIDVFTLIELRLKLDVIIVDQTEPASLSALIHLPALRRRTFSLR